MIKQVWNGSAWVGVNTPEKTLGEKDHGKNTGNEPAAAKEKPAAKEKSVQKKPGRVKKIQPVKKAHQASRKKTR